MWPRTWSSQWGRPTVRSRRGAAEGHFPPTNNPHTVILNWAPCTCIVLNPAGKGASRPPPPPPAFPKSLPSPFQGRGLSPGSFPEPSPWLPWLFSSGRGSCLLDCPLLVIFTAFSYLPLRCDRVLWILLSICSGVSGGELIPLQDSRTSKMLRPLSIWSKFPVRGLLPVKCPPGNRNSTSPKLTSISSLLNLPLGPRDIVCHPTLATSGSLTLSLIFVIHEVRLFPSMKCLKYLYSPFPTCNFHHHFPNSGPHIICFSFSNYILTAPSFL